MGRPPAWGAACPYSIVSERRFMGWLRKYTTMRPFRMITIFLLILEIDLSRLAVITQVWAEVIEMRKVEWSKSGYAVCLAAKLMLQDRLYLGVNTSLAFTFC